MANFVAIAYDDMFKAHDVRLTLLKLQQEYLICMEDAVVAVKDENGKVKLHQAVNLTAAGATSGGFWGTLVGLLFFGPFFGVGTLANIIQLLRLPDGQWNGSPNRRRYQNLANVIAIHANRQSDAIPAALAKSIGIHVINAQSSERVIVRCLVHHAQPMVLQQPGATYPSNPNDEAYTDTVYEAVVWKSPDGTYQVLKQSDRREVEPRHVAACVHAA